ncbi:hypothetical protein OCK74_03515 [Chitinophagaceae bacterium LB-8]|uniref:Protein argonaute n=1 Tax=Paraflavisolibacter caeni TaxID=2982496 RepID=A0A9X2XUT2_9BACT|nr:Piwi domain-containing protein [Paraflavisolibacter caeni]MCU7548163.1 hypothetical protein [Paraflavisolibacter caeni]
MELKPHKYCPHPYIQMFFIAHYQDQHLIETLQQYLFKGHGQFPGLHRYVQLNIHPNEELDIVFHDLEHPYREVTIALDNNAFNWYGDITYIAIYISPYKDIDEDPKANAFHYQVINALLERGITLQVFKAEQLNDADAPLEKILADAAVAMLAKLDGIPWRLTAPVKRELTFGISAFKGKADGVPYLGCACNFSNDGTFEVFEVFQKHEVKLLAGFISYMTSRYIYEHEYPSRMVIHFYKKLSPKELEPIQKAIEELQLSKPIPIFLISMHQSPDILAFDMNSEDSMPNSGTIIKVGQHQYLLYNNGKFVNGHFDHNNSFPLPIKLEFDCTDKGLLEDKEVVIELIDQVFQFGHMYWGSLPQQGLPVSVLYPEMMARTLPYFKDGWIPGFGLRNLWFL